MSGVKHGKRVSAFLDVLVPKMCDIRRKISSRSTTVKTKLSVTEIIVSFEIPKYDYVDCERSIKKIAITRKNKSIKTSS